MYYFSELPISKKVNDLILEYVETAMMAEQHIIDICIKKRQIPIIDRIRKNRSAKVFFTLYYDLEDWDFSSVFYSAYGEYYKELMKNETTTQLQNNLESDSDIASRLGFEESFKKIEKVVTKYIEDNKDCKMNVYKMK